MGPGEKRDWNGKLGQSDGVTANKGPSLGEKGGLAEGRTQAAPGPHRRPEARRRRFLAGAGPLPPGLGGKWGGHSSGGTEGAARRARGGEDSHRPAPPCPWRPRPQCRGGGRARVSLRRLLRNGRVTSGD